MAKEIVRSYQDLKVWQVGLDLSVDCYQLTKAFPREEIYGIVSQIRRASVSIPANVAEGYGRASRGDYIRFLRIAQGSLKELETLLEISKRVGYLDGVVDASSSCQTLGRLMTGLIRSLLGSPYSQLPTADSRP
jgi:four helix bundle protein